MSRLAVSLTVSPERDTIQASAQIIVHALEVYGRTNGGELRPWVESRREARGVLSAPSGEAVGAWRILDGEPSPEQVADEVLAQVTGESFTLAQMRTLIGLAVATDRRNTSSIAPDDDF